MVNTFLPWPDANESAKALDNKRLGKQRVEALQILRANTGITQGWRNHPAAVMWRGHEGALGLYARAICEEWTARGYKDQCLEQIEHIIKRLDLESFERPWWMGHIGFHDSHKSNLKRKDPVVYDFDVPDDLPYLWPVDPCNFRTIEKKDK